ncbi:MAG TPA: AAA family ATPase [bacterium]
MDAKENKTAVVVIDLDENSNRTLTAILQELPGIEVTASARDFETGVSLIRKLSPELVILNLYPSDEEALEFAKKITQLFPETTLFITARKANANALLLAMRAGAREFFVQPIHKDELVPAVKKAVQSKKESSQRASIKSKVITVFGAKGGVGTTTVAVNIASTLARRAETNVVLFDLNFQFGNAALLLSAGTKVSILDLVEHIDQVDAAFLREALTKRQGVPVLTGPPRIEDAENIQAGHVDPILMALRSVFDYIVIDTNHVLNDVSIKALDDSDHVLVVAELDVPTICSTTRCLDLFKKMGYDREKLLLVLNRFNRLDEFDPAAMEKLLEYPVFWRLPNQDLRSMTTSVNKGVPIMKMAPHSKLGEGLIKMSEQLNGAVPSKEKKGKKRAKAGFLHKIIG